MFTAVFSHYGPLLNAVRRIEAVAVGARRNVSVRLCHVEEVVVCLSGGTEANVIDCVVGFGERTNVIHRCRRSLDFIDEYAPAVREFHVDGQLWWLTTNPRHLKLVRLRGVWLALSDDGGKEGRERGGLDEDEPEWAMKTDSVRTHTEIVATVVLRLTGVSGEVVERATGWE